MEISPLDPAPDRPFAAIDRLLRQAGLRSTRQRLWLARLLFERGHRHVTADMLAAAAREAGVTLALATIYNALHAFAKVGLLRQLHLGDGRIWFDTHIAPHHHFVDAKGHPADILLGTLNVSGLSQVPSGQKVASIEVIVRLVPEED